MTIEQVADALGLSKTTVSRALSGKGRISEETRTKVYAYMGRTRSEPVSAQSGEKLRTNNIAMVVPQRFIALDLPFLRKCMGGICTMADQRGYDLMLCYASNTEYSQLQRQLANHKVDGVILTYAMAEISDLGLSKILSQYANLLIPFVSMGMSNAIIRFGLDKGNSEKQVFTNGLLTILGGFGILVLCWPVAQFLPDMAQYGLLIYIYVLMSCLRTLCTQFVRSRQWNKLVAVDGVLCTVATMAFYVLYLVGFKWGANGYLLAIISGDLASVLFLMFTGKLWNYVELKGINKDLWKQMLRFSLPMIPAQISFWIINASDLFFVREMCNGLDGRDGNAWSGLLSTGYFLPTILTTLGLIFYDAWQLSAVTEEEGRAKFFTRIFRTYSSVLFCCAAGIIWLCRPVMHVMKSNYYYAWHFVPFLVLASTCSCFNQFMNSVYVVNKKSQRSMATMMAGAISNCLMNYFFIKWWGPVGATYASFLGLGLVFTLRAMDAHGMIGMRVHPGRVLVNAAALVFEAFVLLAETPLYGLWTGIITALIILYNFSGVWAMARILLPKILGRRGKALVAVVDGWAAKK